MVNMIIATNNFNHAKNMFNSITEMDKNIRIIGISSNKKETIERLKNQSPDILILDFEISERNMIEIQHMLNKQREKEINTKIIIISKNIEKLKKVYGYNEKICYFIDRTYNNDNIGKKIPKSWSFDQFNEIKDYRNIIDLDKVMYSGNANLVTKLKSGNPNFEIVNKNLYEKLEYVYNLAKEYEPNGTIAKWNYMVVNYFRHASYKGAGWDTIVGTVPGWINYVNNRLPDNVSENIYSKQMYIYDRKLNISMQFEHMAAVLASLLYNSNIVYTTYIDSNGNEIKTQSPENLNIEFTGRQSKITDLCGWAGDLVQLLNKTSEERLQSQEGNTDVEKLMSLIGNLPTSVNNDSSDYEVCKALAYRYVSKEDPETAILVNLFNFINYGILDANRWKNIAPEAWKNKIKNYIELGL